VTSHRVGSTWFRVIGWLLVAAGATGLAVGLSRSADWSGAAVGLAVLAGFLGVLTVEATLLIPGQMGNRTTSPAPPVGSRPADGVVDVAAMVGVRSVGLAPWKRFVTLESTDCQPSPLRESVVRSAASNPPLLGEVALVSVFVGLDGRPWSDREIRDAHESLRAVGRWVEREAMAWGAPVNLGLADTYFQVEDEHDDLVELEFVAEGDDFGPMEANATTKSMATASRSARTLGFADVADLMSRINPRITADVPVWLFHLKRRGRSHAIPAGDRVIPGVGLAICYARESSFPEPLTGPGRVDPTTVAHELLHLFGAEDKYGTSLHEFPPGLVPTRDVMRLAEDRLDRLQIGRLTAREVGWQVNSVRAVRNKKPALRTKPKRGWKWGRGG